MSRFAKLKQWSTAMTEGSIRLAVAPWRARIQPGEHRARAKSALDTRRETCPACRHLRLAVHGTSQTAAELRDHDRLAARERAAPERVQAFAQTMGCNVVFDHANVVVRWHGNPEIRHVALVTLDAGCSGGSRSWRPLLIALRAGTHGNLYVNPEYSAPGFTSAAFPQAMDSISSVGGTVRFFGRRAMPGDPDSHPSRQVTGTVFLTASGWTPHRDSSGIPPAG